MKRVQKHMLIGVAACMFAVGGAVSAKAQIDPDNDELAYTMSVNVGGRFGFSTWAKKIVGDLDPGIFGDEWNGRPLHFNLVWSGGRYKSLENSTDTEGTWYCLFFSMDSSESYRLRVTTTPIDPSLSKGILLTAGFAAEDMYKEIDPFGIEVFYSDDPVVDNTEYIGQDVALSETGFNPPYEKTVYSWDDCQSGQLLYRNTVDGLTRIVRCYVSVFDWFAEWDPRAAAQKALASGDDPIIAPIQDVPAGLTSATGTITFTMEPAS
jgi:hypothetical protein